MKHFTTTGLCIPGKHYMVDMSDRIEQIADMVKVGKYFMINKARQYGKTTTLFALSQRLSDEYYIASLDFQSLSTEDFKDEGSFTKAMAQLLISFKEDAGIKEGYYDTLCSIADGSSASRTLSGFFSILSGWCADAEKPVVLMIDEVDSASNNQVFLDFLAQLRYQYLEREKRPGYGCFYSVILAGVTDIRHLRSRIRDEDQHKLNSPWNIAADFNVDMSLPENGIKNLLDEYQSDHETEMETAVIAREIHAYTNGYPFLVSRLCQIMDEQLVPDKFNSPNDAWSLGGFDEAVKIILSEKNTLFDSLAGRLINSPDLKTMLRSMLIGGNRIAYNPQQDTIAQMEMHGFITNVNGAIAVSNRIFETVLYNLFLSDEESRSNSFAKEGDADRNRFIRGGRLDVRLILERFITAYTEIMGPLTDRFSEKDGRELFLLYLKPIINGTGNYYIEAQTRDQLRTDVIIDYLGQRYVIEMKIWRGPRYNEAGEKQLIEYLDYYCLDTGYLLSFNFNKSKKQGVEKIAIGDRTIYEATL